MVSYTRELLSSVEALVKHMSLYVKHIQVPKAADRQKNSSADECSLELTVLPRLNLKMVPHGFQNLKTHSMFIRDMWTLLSIGQQ